MHSDFFRLNYHSFIAAISSFGCFLVGVIHMYDYIYIHMYMYVEICVRLKKALIGNINLQEIPMRQLT